MEELYLVYLSMILLLGTLVSALANKLKISNVMFLVFSGMLLGTFGLITFPKNAIIIISTLAMVITIFDSTVKLKFKEIEKFSSNGMKLVLLNFILTVAVITALVYFYFDLNSSNYFSFILALSISCLIYGIDHPLTLETSDIKKNNKTIKLLEIESLLNRPLTLIAPLILLNYMQALVQGQSIFLGNEILLFFKQILFGIVIGLISGYIMLIILNTKLKQELSYLIVLTGSIVTFIFSEHINASGVLSLTVFALIFGNFHIKHKLELERFASVFSYIFNIFVFILVGTIMMIEFRYILRGSLIFLAYLVVRIISVNLSLFGSDFNFKEKLFISLNITKGMEVAIIILIMLIRYKDIPGMDTIINLSLLFSLYSFIISNLTGVFSYYLLKNEQEKKRH
ncbi:hypothetical protein GF327_09910 [Candidatus Woesearchaeota archaeon]|nr:hypothetical protein [Candidatus Woesearchaeota archaeon]